MDKIQISAENLKRVNEWIRGADQKISIFLAFEGVLITILIPNYSKTITARFTTHTISLLNEVLIVSAMLAFLVAVVSTLFAIFPRVSNKAKSHLYFGSINTMGLTRYRDGIKNMTQEKYFEELSEQIYTNSDVAVKKYYWFQVAIIAFIIEISLLIGSYISLKFF